MKNHYTFPCVLSYDGESSIAVHFPDIEGCYTCGSDEQDAIQNAKEALGLHLVSLEIDKELIPLPSALHAIQTNQNEILVLIDVYMPLFRHSVKEHFIKKTLTIPKWLDEAAIKQNINFSKLLQEALKQKLGIHRHFDL